MQALIDNAAPDQALTAIASAPDPDALWHLRAAALRAIAEKTEKASNWDDLLAHLEHRHATTGDPSALLAACQVMFRRREWAYVIQRSDQLIAEWGTAEAVRLAALAAFYARRFERCLTILDAHLDYFPHRSPRGGLRQARIMCLDERGRRPEAIGDALGWVADENSAEAILTLLRLYRDDGDLAALTVHARGLRGRADLTPEQALRGAALVRHEDGPLARELWDKAVHHPDLPDDAVASAWMLGREIRFAQELRPLGPRLPAAAAKCFQID